MESPAESERMDEDDNDNEAEEEEALEVKSWEDEEESELAGLIDPEDDTRHVVELPKLPTSVWKGHCFRSYFCFKIWLLMWIDLCFKVIFLLCRTIF